MYYAFVCMVLRSHGTQVMVTSPKEGIWTAEMRGGPRLFNHDSCAKWYSKPKQNNKKRTHDKRKRQPPENGLLLGPMYCSGFKRAQNPWPGVRSRL